MMPVRFEPVKRAFSALATWVGTLLFAVVCTSAMAATDTFTASGTWVAPTGTTSATVEVWGGGGGGGAATSNPSKGGGGAGGQYAKKVVTVVPGTSYAVAVGAGGSGGTVGFFSNPDGGAGGTSSFASTTVVAKGGAGGTGATNGVAGAGSATGGVGDTVYAGGSGSSGTSAGAGGAGGGGAGSTGAGGAASGTTAGTGTATGGGAGGAGLSSRAGGNAGTTYGGGGGGGYATSNTDQVGGDGAGGKVVITYTLTPAVASITRASYNPTNKGKLVTWTVVFNTSVTGVDTTDFSLTQAGGAAGASISGVTGSGTTWTVTANTGTGSAGTVTLKLVDDDSIAGGGLVLGGVGTGNGNFTGEAYTLIASPCTGASDILFCDDFERSNAGVVGNGWTSSPANTSGSCSGTTGNIGCSGIDADVPPWNSASTTLRPNPSRSMFTRWATGTVDSPTVNLAGKAGAQLSFWIRRGQDTFSECPEASGENYLVQYFASNSTWKTLAQYPSSPTAALCDGKIFTPTIQLPSDALHSGFKLRFYQPSGSGFGGFGGAPNVLGYDYWHMDDVVIRELTAPTYTGAFCENFEAGLGRWSITAEGAPTTATIGDADISTTFSQSTSHSLALRWGYVSASTFSTDLTGVSGNITYWVKSGSTATTDPVTGEDLVVEYLNSSSVWTTLATYPGTAAAGTSYSATFALPADAKHANFRLRMRKLAGTGYDKSYWYVDDICVGNALATADLALTKTGGTLVPGSTTVYTLHASNNGPGTLSGSVQIVDTLPSGVSYLGSSGAGWSCSANAQVVTCGWTGTLASGAAPPDLLLTVSVAGSVTGSITNTAVLSGTVNDPNLSNNTASYTSGNFTPVFIFTSGVCVDGIEIGQPGQTCSLVDWSNMVAGQTKSNIYLSTVNSSGVPTKLSGSGATTVNLQFGLTCHDPIADAGVQAAFSAATPAALPLCSGNGIEPTTQWSASKTFTFPSGSPSVATAYTFSYADVGQVELWMRNASATSQKGVSGTFVQKPAGFTLSEIKPTANASGRCAVATSPAPALACASLASDAARFVMAGESFSATVTALTSTGGAAPNFGKEKIPEGVALNADNVIASMGLAPDVIGDFGSFTNGVATGTAFTWGEVGIITLTPSVKDGDYLGAGDVTGTVSGNVGRFYPHHFETTVTPGCGSTFTYSGQPFAFRTAAYTATGSGASGLTTNYNGTTGLSRVTTLSGVGGSGVITGGNVSGQPTQFTAASFTLGATPLLTDLGVLKPTFTYSTVLTAATDITLRIVDTDGVTSSGASEAVTNVRSGRARMFNAYGSELLDLPVIFRTEYWAGTSQGWVLNSADTCTDATISFAAAGSTDITSNTCVLEPTNNSGKGCAAAVATATHKYLEAGVSGTDSLGVAGFAGNFNVWLKAPGASHPGSIDVTANVPAWLQFNWTGTVGNPKGRATFGVYKSPLIYRRENY